MLGAPGWAARLERPAGRDAGEERMAAVRHLGQLAVHRLRRSHGERAVSRAQRLVAEADAQDGDVRRLAQQRQAQACGSPQTPCVR
jgi:hypothetical protein